MSGFIEDYFASRVAESLADGSSERIERLLSGAELIEFDSGAAVLVGHTPKYNVAVFKTHVTEDRLTFRGVMSELIQSFKPVEGNAMGITPNTFEAWSEMYSETFTAINELHFQQAMDEGVSKPWMFIGYAGGGAVAQIAAASFKPAKLITFGAPDAGNAVLEEAVFQGCTWSRWEFMSDFNTRIPLRLRRSTEGNTRYIDSDGVLETEPKLSLRSPKDWFERSPITAYSDWMDGAIHGR
jgi:hypothetical protein